MKTLHITSLIAIAIIIFASSCSDPSSEIIPNGNNEIENRDPGNVNPPNDSENDGINDSGNDSNGNNEDANNNGNDKGGSNSEDKTTGCGIRISSSDLPGALAEYLTRTYSTTAPYYHISKVEVCMENGEITSYTVTMKGPHSLTLNFNADGSPKN